MLPVRLLWSWPVSTFLHKFLEFHNSRSKENDSCSRWFETGLQRCTNDRDDRFITLAMLRNRNLTVIETRNRVAEVQKEDQGTLECIGLMAEGPTQGSKLTRRHRVNSFARAHIYWNLEQWSKILFTDKSQFYLLTGSRWSSQNLEEG